MACQISIHLMLMLISAILCYKKPYINFNTSHVNVNPSSGLSHARCILHFNTSHVNVNPVNESERGKGKLFQYISC